MRAETQRRSSNSDITVDYRYPTLTHTSCSSATKLLPIKGLISQSTLAMADDPQADPIPQFGFKKRSKAKANFRKKPATPPPASDSDSGFTSSDDDEGRRIKRRRKNVAVVASSATNAAKKHMATEEPSSAGPVKLSSSNDATKQSNWYDEDLSSKSLLGSTRTRPQDLAESTPDGTYKGSANYQSFIQKNPDAPSKKFGPVKVATNVRTITVTDYAPDVCKDWKQTGKSSEFCEAPGQLD